MIGLHLIQDALNHEFAWGQWSISVDKLPWRGWQVFMTVRYPGPGPIGSIAQHRWWLPRAPSLLRHDQWRQRARELIYIHSIGPRPRRSVRRRNAA